MGLDVGLVDPVRLKGPLDRDVRRGQLGSSVARDVALPVEDVGREVLDIQHSALATDRCVGGLRRSSLRVVVRDERHEAGKRAVDKHRSAQIHHHRQPFEIDDHELRAVCSSRLCLGHHQRDRLPGEQHLASGQRLEHPHVVGGDDRQISGRQHGDHARDGQSGRRIDPDDPRMGIDAGDDPGVQQADHRHVRGVAGGATDFLVRVGPRSGDPNAICRAAWTDRHPVLLMLARRARGRGPRRRLQRHFK